MEPITYIAVVAALFKVVDLVKYASRANVRQVVTQLLAFAVGIGAAFLIGAADIAETWDVGAGKAVTDMDGWSKVVLGVVWGAGASALYDFKKAFDGGDSAHTPSLPIANKSAVVDGQG